MFIEDGLRRQESFFEGRFEEANRVGGEMIKAIMESEVKREESEGFR